MSILHTGFVLIAAATIFVQTFLETIVLGFSQDDSAGVSRDDCVGDSRSDSRVRDSRNESHDPRHWVPATAVEDEENMWTEMDSDVLR